jgi:hypothetical protein
MLVSVTYVVGLCVSIAESVIDTTRTPFSVVTAPLVPVPKDVEGWQVRHAVAADRNLSRNEGATGCSGRSE